LGFGTAGLFNGDYSNKKAGGASGSSGSAGSYGEASSTYFPPNADASAASAAGGYGAASGQQSAAGNSWGRK